MRLTICSISSMNLVRRAATCQANWTVPEPQLLGGLHALTNCTKHSRDSGLCISRWQSPLFAVTPAEEAWLLRCTP